MSYEVRAIEYKRTGRPHCPRVRVVHIIAHNVLSLEMAVDLAARHNEDVQPDELAWVSELPSPDQVKP